jgi:tetratricopeptide (TPR) repeat protein
MSATSTATTPRCDLLRLERTNMVTKLEDRVKVDLVALSNVILDNLRLCDPDSLTHNPEMLKRIAVQFNQGALLQYQYGEIEKAEVLCRGEIELFAHLSSCSPHRALCLASMVAPYINLARIFGQKGEVRESLSIFEDIYRFGLRQQDLCMFGHRISVADETAMCEASPQGFQKLLLSCRVIEAARVLQTIEDYSALLVLIDKNESLPEYQDTFFKQYLLELRSRVLLHFGRYEQAMQALEECCGLMPLNTTDRVVAHLLLSQIYREWGRSDSAAETLDKLEQHFAALEQFGRRLPIIRQIAYRIALERHLLSDNRGALAPAEKAFRLCSELSDQPGCIKTAILLLRICSDPAIDAHAVELQRQWYRELKQLASTTFFSLERACAYWELGLAAESLERNPELAREFLENSARLYALVPFVDSRQSCEAVKRSLDSRIRSFPVRSEFDSGVITNSSAAIDSTFAALMEFVSVKASSCL